MQCTVHFDNQSVVCQVMPQPYTLENAVAKPFNLFKIFSCYPVKHHKLCSSLAPVKVGDAAGKPFLELRDILELDAFRRDCP